MNLFYQSAFLKALGWSLIDSLWQMGVLWLLYILVTSNGKKLNPSSRYLLAVLAVVSGLLWFAIALGFNYFHLDGGRRLFGIAYLISNELPLINDQKWVPLISSMYILAVLFYVARWTFQVVGSRNIYHERLGCPNKHYESFLNELGKITGITRNIRLWISEKITTPVTFGFFRPVILLPVAALTQLTSKQVEALIVHEFYHIKRNDYLVNIFMTLCEIMLFFNPFAKMLIGTIRKERENCCDDEVIGLGYDRWEYAQALYLLGKNDIAVTPHFALAATGKGKQLLLERVKRMLHRGNSSPSLLKPLSIFFLCLVVAGSMSRNLKKSPEVPLTITTRENTIVAFAQQEIKVGTEEQPIIVVDKKPVKKERISRAITAEISFPAPPPPPPAPISVTEAENYENLVLTSYIVCANEQTIEFCFIEAPVYDKNLTGQPENCDDSHPYVPASTFYFPGHEISGIEDGKTTVQL